MPSPIPFQETRHPAFAESAAMTFVVIVSGRHRTFSGPCPRCADHMEFPWDTDTHLNLAVERDSARVPFVCTCRIVHPNTPNGLFGCGAMWDMTLDG